MITAEQVRHALDYDPATGVFLWKNPGKMANKRYRTRVVAGSVARNGRLMINIGGKLRLAHRLAWLYVYGEEPAGWLDHKDGDPLNNRIENLRVATPSQNTANMRLTARNTSGKKGVTWHKPAGKWQAQIRSGGKHYSLGLYHSVDEAHAAYMAAAQERFGEFARAG